MLATDEGRALAAERYTHMCAVTCAYAGQSVRNKFKCSAAMVLHQVAVDACDGKRAVPWLLSIDTLLVTSRTCMHYMPASALSIPIGAME